MKKLVLLVGISLVMIGCGQKELEESLVETPVEDVVLDEVVNEELEYQVSIPTEEELVEEEVLEEPLVFDFDRFADNSELVFSSSEASCQDDLILYEFAAEANSEELYESFDKGISFLVPYDEDWGRGQYNVPVYSENDEKVLFGPLVYPAGPCRMVGNIEMSLLDVKDYDYVVANSADYIGVDLEDAEVYSAMRDDLGVDVLEFSPVSFCETKDYIVFGEDYNYYFKTPGCGNVLGDYFLNSIELL